jgi:biopolymer transport protein ExbD
VSHGGGGGDGETVEVNLIPMIDIVIQLITFFLMLVNFDNSNKDERVRLPVADLAKPSDSDIDEPLVLNIDNAGRVNILGEMIDGASPIFRQHMGREAQAALANMSAHGQIVERVAGRPKLWTTVLIRADKDVEYGKVQGMIKTCQEFGFYKFALRANPNRESM